MPRKCILTWQPGSGDRPGRWRKKYKGRVIYCGHGNSKSDIESYKKAVSVWEAEKRRIDAEIASQPKENHQEYEDALRDWDRVLQWCQTHGDLANAALAREKISQLQQRLESDSPPPLVYGDQFWDSFDLPEKFLETIAAMVSYPGSATPPNPSSRSTVNPKELKGGRDIFISSKESKREIWYDRLKVQAETPEEPENTVQAHLDAYLNQEQLRVDAGRLSASRFTSKRNHLLRFRDWIGSRTPITSIDGRRIQDFHQHLLTQIAENSLAQDTAHDRLVDTKSFVRWLWQMDFLESLPRNLERGSNALVIGKKVSAPDAFSIREIKSFLKEATGRPRLYILLMLNCGMYQTDISNIRHDEVNWRTGTITRKRSKTKKHASVPVVCYKLWKETLQLLREYREKKGELVLLNTDGSPLVVRGIKPNGDPTTNDAITNSLKPVREKIKIHKPAKLFRKTSASLIKSNSEFRGLEDLFLGLSPNSISDRHYAKVPTELLAEATAWLAKQYGVK